MKSALITGANKGIGLEVAKILSQQGYHVYLGTRNIDNAKDINLSNVEVIQLDVTDPTSIENARKSIKQLDVLVNNAGISGVWEQSALSTTVDDFKTVLETNLYGVIRVTQAFIDLLKQSPEPRIVNVSTAMASLSQAADITNSHYPKRYVVYQTSKAALNMYTINLAYELQNTAVKVNAVCPGYTKTDFTNHQGTSTVEEAGQRIAKYAMIGQDGPTGKFFSEEYFPAPATCPW
jgi:NAD(P)-dependent dehydrogenase (short-subunit alcohol dehydrogenase family)